MLGGKVDRCFQLNLQKSHCEDYYLPKKDPNKNVKARAELNILRKSLDQTFGNIFFIDDVHTAPLGETAQHQTFALRKVETHRASLVKLRWGILVKPPKWLVVLNVYFGKCSG